MSTTDKYIQIDEEGYPLFGELRVQDEDVGAEILNSLELNELSTVLARSGEETAIVEAFDEPIVAQQVHFNEDQWFIQGLYQTKFSFKLESLSLDEWDRFHGYTDNKVPFVFSRKAQAQFFNLLDDYTDESITHKNVTYEVPLHLKSRDDIHNSQFWTQIYHEEKKPGWDLGQAAEALKTMLPKLKLPKSRILVLGCGEGHDAAFFAKDGHMVTAVDFSSEAIHRAQNHYASLSNIKFVEKDVFKLGSEFDNSYDIVFEHTCFCAIDPLRRNDLVKVWNRCLVDKGYLMGIFFTMDRPHGPPFGSSEWELRQRLKKYYQFLFWGRWRNSLPKRQGKELFVYAQKKSL